jgi:hypothetical protein
VTPVLRLGGFGQLDVLVDGVTVFSKKRAGHSPTSDEIVRLLAAGRG